MATVYGAEYTKYNTGGLAKLVTKTWGNDVKFVSDTFTSPTGDLAHSSTIKMGRLPKGARVLAFHFTCGGEGGTAATGGVKVGDTAATAVNALTTMAAASSLWLGAANALARTPLAADSDVEILLQDTNALDATTTLSLTTLYIMDN